MGNVIKIEESEYHKEGLKSFHILFGVKTLGIFANKNAREFIKKDYFYKFVSNLKNKEYFFLFSSQTLSAEKCTEVTTPENIKEAFLLASSFSSVYQEKPTQIGIGTEQCGREMYLLIFKNDKIINIKRIFELIDSGTTWFYFMFGERLEKDKLFFAIKNFQQKDCLNEENIINLCSEVIKYQSKDYFSDELKIVSRRFNKEQLKTMFINSVGRDKVEVIAK